MGEIRLICPGCAAEYLLDDSAIPAAGRTVECTACGRVWHAPGAERRLRLRGALDAPQDQDAANRSAGHEAPAGANAAAPQPEIERPRLNRPLPTAVLTILQEEAARERAAREAQADVADDPGNMAGETDRHWPATTVTDASTPQPATIPPSSRSADGIAAPESTARHIHERPLNTASDSEPGTMAATLQRSTPSLGNPGSETPPNAPQTVPRRRGRAGFWTGILLAAAIAGAYVAAPHVPADSALSDPAQALRGQIDGMRIWLADLVGIQAG